MEVSQFFSKLTWGDSISLSQEIMKRIILKMDIDNEEEPTWAKAIEPMLGKWGQPKDQLFSLRRGSSNSNSRQKKIEDGVHHEHYHVVAT